MAHEDDARGYARQPSRLRRMLMKVFGPPDLGAEHQGNPLTGTKYDPAIKKARREERRRKRKGPEG